MNLHNFRWFFVNSVILVCMAFSGWPQNSSWNRWISLESAKNTRDIGGYVTSENLQVKTGVLIRSDKITQLTANDVSRLKSIGLRTVIDLRTLSETASDPDSQSIQTFARYVQYPINYQSLSSYEEIYVNILDINAGSFAGIFSELAKKENFPLLYHCAAGTDRTGIVTALIHLLLGVSRDDILADYLLSRNAGKQVESSWLQAVLNRVTQEGGIYQFLLNCGISQNMQAAVRSNLLEPLAQPTPTPFIPTNTPTSLPILPTYTPIPILPTPTFIPTPVGKIQPDLVYEFNQSPLENNGWNAIPGGFNSAAPGSVTVGPFFFNPIPSSFDQKGLILMVKPNDVVFLYAALPVSTNGKPVLLKLIARADSANATLALVALKGNLGVNATDGSIATHVPASISGFVDRERNLILLYQSDNGDLITPAFQLAGGKEGGTVTVLIDRLEVFLLDRETQFSGTQFFANP